MNVLTIKNNLTLDSIEVAEMMMIQHKEILRKLEGGKDRKGYIEILTEHQMAPSKYFIESSYTNYRYFRTIEQKFTKQIV